jgi:general stress protein 26
MDKQPQSDPGMNKLADLIDEIRIGMLTTVEPDGSLRSRPLATLQMDSDGRLWFFTSITSPKVEEIDQHNHVCITYADPDEEDYVSVSGVTQILRERAKIKELWTSWAKPWFPQGPDDPDLALLCVTIESAEYWDAPGSKMVQLLGLAKAIQSGDPKALGEHAKVQPGRPRPNA